MKSIHYPKDSFFDKYKSSMFASRDVYVYFGKKMCSHLRCLFYMYKELTRLLNTECFESAFPAIFLSNAPTFFIYFPNERTIS